MKITSNVFDAHLKCAMKCWLRAIGERSSGNTYAEWVKTQNDIFRETEIKRLVNQRSDDKIAFSPSIAGIQAAKWQIAFNLSVQAKMDNCVLETICHAMERVPSTREGNHAQYIPIRFAFANKLGKDENLLLGFDAFVLSESLSQEIRFAKIIHGDDSTAKRVRVSTLTTDIRKRIQEIAALISSPIPPELVLNPHCMECEFRHHCYQKAKESGELSLLSGISEKERARHRSKGIFTVSQLSYTFRPRRTPKRAKNPAKPRYFALQALSIRENCIHIHGTPVLPDCQSKVYLDIEGLPDRNFYYLIGAQIVTEEGETFHSFWADTQSDEATIFLQFAETISQLPDYRIFHYGSYDEVALRRVAARLPVNIQERFEPVLRKFVNILTLVYPHIYFPTYSNSLKQIASQLAGNSVSQAPTGLDSVVWRMQWEICRDSHLRTKLIEYNKSDCIALQQLTDFIRRRLSNVDGTFKDGITVKRTEDMKAARPHWQLFAVKAYALPDLEYVSKSAYFDYQREKVFIRTHPKFKSILKRVGKKGKGLVIKPDKVILVEVDGCPNCQSHKLYRDSESSHIVVDLKFSKKGVKKLVKRLVSWRYSCQKCGKSFRSEERLPNPQRYGHGLASWCVYQNSVLGVNMSKVKKNLADLFGLHLDQTTLDRTKNRVAVFYEPLYAEILNVILASPVLHIDETTVRLRQVHGYVWVLTTFDHVYYFYRPSRETEFLKEMLASFRGVLVSDFYSGYDFLPCEQQKCLVHLIRDIDDDLLHNPFDEELRQLATAFGILLRAIISSIDRFGLRCRHLKKHRIEVEKFLKVEVATEFKSGIANKYGKRFKKYGSKMFTFLEHDGVPWNNNNAEHAIKRFAKYRRDTDGRYSERTLKEYLVLASVFETCEFNNVNVLMFLLSQEKSIEGLERMAGRKTSGSK